MTFDYRVAFASFQSMALGFLRSLPYIIVALIVFSLFYVSAIAVRRMLTRFTEQRKKHRNAGLVLGRLAEGGMMLLGVLVALMIAIPSFKPGQLIQILGIGSVAIGFAFRDILQNFLAGLLILLTEPFRIDDQIIIGNYEGTVENIETRATLLRTYDGRRVVIPNSTLFTDSVLVNTAFSSRRLQYDIGIGYGDDIASACKLILETLSGMDGVLKDPPPEALVVDLAASTVNIRARWWINPPRRTDVVVSMNNVLTALKNRLTEAGFDLPYPTQQILFHDQTEETDGDRRHQREGWPAGAGDIPRARPIGTRALNGSQSDKEGVNQ